MLGDIVLALDFLDHVAMLVPHRTHVRKVQRKRRVRRSVGTTKHQPWCDRSKALFRGDVLEVVRAGPESQGVHRIQEALDLEYDQTAANLQIAGLEIPVRGMATDAVEVGQIPLNDRIAWCSYWTRWFPD